MRRQMARCAGPTPRPDVTAAEGAGPVAADAVTRFRRRWDGDRVNTPIRVLDRASVRETTPTTPAWAATMKENQLAY